MKNQTTKPDIFTRFSSSVSKWVGRPWMFVFALLALALWAISGPFLGFSDTWQLIINTSTTIITFLIVFIIQNTQNRDNMAMNVKLDALLEKLKVSDKMLLEAEDQSDKAIEKEKRKVQRKRR
jgi:low affinity Fe/Cu permease